MGVSPSANAYPDFIGYGYSSCITCHYNSLGSGALNDYGRALFATEVTARDIFPASKSEEEVAAMSGFLGTTQLPWWFRTGIKYRGLWLKTGLTSDNSVERFINMQGDVNLNVFFNKKQDIGLITTASYAGKEFYYDKQYQWYMKEFYLRWKALKTLWIYIGQLEKAYGLRMIDHTAVNRSPLTLGQFDQSIGIITHFTYPDWDIALNAFVGNTQEKDEVKQKGFSGTGEYQVFEKFKIGGSILSSESDIKKYNLMAFTTRIGVREGSAFLGEVGIKELTDKTSNAEAKLGTYALIQAMVHLRRGYNLLSTVEQSREDINKSSREYSRWSIGGLLFLLPRTELRMMLVNGKGLDETTSIEDSWSFQGQFHVSY